MPDFVRMFLKLKYIDLTKNTYIRSRTVTEIMASKSVVLLRFHVLYLFRVTYHPYTEHVRRLVYSPLERFQAVAAHVKCLEP